MNSNQYPGTGPMVLGALMIGLSVACAAILLLAVTGLLEGHFDKLPFLQNFLAIVSQNDSVTLTVQGQTQLVKLPQSIFFVSAVSMFVFSLAIAAKLVRAFLTAGVELIQGGSRKKFEDMIAELKEKYR